MIRRTVRRRKAGFTLAELLVALVVICLLSTCVFLITRSAAGTFTRGEDVISANDLKSIALEYVKQELRTASTIMLTDDLEADGGELIKSGALLFSHGGRLYTADANVDGELPLDYPGGAGSAPLPSSARPFFAGADAETNIYGNYDIEISFSPITNTMTGKTNSLKVTVAVYRSGEFMLEGSEVVDLINMRQENGEIKGAAGRYCFYAA